MDLTLFELTIEHPGSDRPSGGDAGDGHRRRDEDGHRRRDGEGDRRRDGGGRPRSGRELDVRVSDDPPASETSGPSWGTVATVAVTTAVLAAAATALAVWYLRRGKGDDDEGTRGGSPTPEMGSVPGESAAGGSTTGESTTDETSGSRVPFRG